MQTVTIAQINERLLKLPQEKLIVVDDFISYLLERDFRQLLMRTTSESFQTMLASEDVLRRDWDLPEEDEAWADL
jgi:hypothetical protein